MTIDTNPIEQVRRRKARYCRFIDTKQWDEFAELLSRTCESGCSTRTGM